MSWAGPERRRFDRRSVKPEERAYVETCAAGGGRFVGVWRGLPNGEDLLLFDSPTTRSALALPLSRLTVAEIQRELAECDCPLRDSQTGGKTVTKDQLENVSMVPLTVTQTRRYRVLVRVKGESRFVGNGLRFDTECEAERYARDLFGRWTAVEEWKTEEVV